MPLFEHVAEDYVTTELSLKGHPCGFFRPLLDQLGVMTNRRHSRRRHPNDTRVTVAGLVLVRQRPGTAKGVVFSRWRTRPASPTSSSGATSSRRTAAWP
jgi:error-prone DNA polymerase